MARPRKPTNILKLSGAFETHPERKRARASEPKPQGEIGPAPKHLSPKERACFAEIVGLCHPGTLFTADRLIVEHGARLLAQLRSDRHYLDTKLMVRLESALGRLGLSPADRSRVNVVEPKAPNRFLVGRQKP